MPTPKFTPAEVRVGIRDVLKREPLNAVGVTNGKTLTALNLAPDTVRMKVNDEFFPKPHDGLSDAQVTGGTLVLTLIMVTQDLLRAQGRLRE